MKVNPRFHFISFGGGSQNFRDACVQVTQQAKESKCFDEVHAFYDSSLSEPQHSEFNIKFGSFIKKNPRGYGYWIWKSYLINFVLNAMQDGDVLLYADAGCRLMNKKHLPTLILEIQKNHFIANEVGHSNGPYTSKKVLDKFDPNGHFFNLRMIEATIIGITASDKTRKLMVDWLVACQKTDLLLDVDSELEPTTFIEHRHDQSILSMLLYSTYKEFLPSRESQKILGSAIQPLRMRRPLDLQSYQMASMGGITLNILKISDFEFIKISSQIGSHQELNDFYSLITPEFKQAYSFHTSKEISPYILFNLKKLGRKTPKLLIIENRSKFEKRITRLSIQISNDSQIYDDVTTVYYQFGGFYNDSPLLVSLPNCDFSTIRIISHNQEPTSFHLKSVYFYA